MTNETLEQLLNEDESSALDFKRDQYPFDRAAPEQKCELLKDILAFANAWRRSDSYILIGIDEVKGGRSNVIGVTVHLDDSKLQQFVNSKTQRPVDFSYQVFPCQDVQIGVLRIPVQQRPLYLTKDYGKLGKDVVYIRRGSSTGVADPEEVARMGLAGAPPGHGAPILDLQFANTVRRKKWGTELRIQSTVLEPLDVATLEPPKSLFGFGFTVPAYLMNPHYHEDLVRYVTEVAFLTPVQFVVENRSSEAALGVELKLVTPVQKGVRLLDDTQRLRTPARDMLARLPFVDGLGGLTVEECGEHWEATLDLGTVRPGSTSWLDDPLYIGGDDSQELQIEAFLYAENLPAPVRFELKAMVQTGRDSMEMSHLEPFMKRDRA